MALGDKKKNAGAAAAKEKTNIKKGPEFDTAGAEATSGDPGASDAAADAAAGVETVEAEVVQEPEASAETEVVVAEKAAAPALNTGRPQLAYAEIEGAMGIIDFGVLNKFHGGSGQILDGENKSLGTEIKLTLLSWRYTWMVSPGEKSEESNDFVKYSDDGKTLNDTQQLIAEYIAEIKGDWPKTALKQYVELTGILEEANGKDKDMFIGDMIQVSLSPVSRKAFEAFRMQIMVKTRMGRMDKVPEMVTITAEPASIKGNDFTKLATK